MNDRRKSQNTRRSFVPASSAAPQSNGDSKKDMWSSLLDSVASGRRLPEKNVLVLGGTPDTQKEFLETLALDSSKRPPERQRRRPPIANEFALGYTYQDVLDADHEDNIARLSIYLLAEPSSSFASLLQPLITARSVPDTLIVILLDWAEPWAWVRNLRDWVRLLREVLVSLDNETKEAMEDLMQEWQQRRRGVTTYDGGGGVSGEGNVAIPLGLGEWDEGLGLPLCVVCINSDKIEALEKESGWREEEFDYVLQFLRTILMKHGASLIYTTPSMPNSLSTLVHSTLGIHSLLKRDPLKHNVTDREKVLIPPSWDSWGKIRVVREGFDVEGVSKGWDVDIQRAPHENGSVPQSDTDADRILSECSESLGVLAVYENTIQDPKRDNRLVGSKSLANQLEIETPSTQEFLTSQLEVVEQLKASEEQSQENKSSRGALGASANARVDDSNTFVEGKGRVNEHIGPVQFNMGGIQVDAEDMLKRLKDRDAPQTPERDTQTSANPDGKAQNENLAKFFADLTKKVGANSPRATPPPRPPS